MKKITVCLMAALFAALMITAAFADPAPELRGTWRGPVLVQTTGEFRESKCAFVIDVQNDRMFTGYKLWFTKNNVLAKEKFSGIFDDGQLYFAEGNDGYGFGYLTDKQAMTINYLEHGSAAKALYYTLKRVHFTTGFVEIDKDGDNILMTAEITTHYPLNAERIMKEADANGDGKLTKKEWEAWKKANDFKE
ncbi:MAG: calcium-binding protein [Pseudodesulfovibrio sp.]|nr:calcium-binding protein [Pseudodesulfovibrio sp.]